MFAVNAPDNSSRFLNHFCSASSNPNADLTIIFRYNFGQVLRSVLYASSKTSNLWCCQSARYLSLVNSNDHCRPTIVLGRNNQCVTNANAFDDSLLWRT